MHARFPLRVVAATLALIATAIPYVPAIAAGPSGPHAVTRTIGAQLTATMSSGTPGTDIGVQAPELPAAGGNTAHGAAHPGQASASRIVNRTTTPRRTVTGPATRSDHEGGRDTRLVTSFDGIDHRDQRLANGGNQFSLEPPDQGLCAGNGFVVEAVNDAVAVYDTAGNPKTGTVALNPFFGYAPAINRSTGARGPFVTDPSCYYDQPTHRWFLDILTLDVDPTSGAFLGSNHIDLAVSQTADPTGAWTIYRLPVQDDGTSGTPNHGCSLGPCLGDYPHIGADASGFYVTTNEYSFFGPEFHAAQIYAFSKAALAASASTVAVSQFDTAGLVGGNPGFTVWPAVTPGYAYDGSHGGTESFLSSDAAAEANGTGTSRDLIVWSLSHTASLASASPSLGLSSRVLRVAPYSIPPASDQKAGDIPLGQCLNDPTGLAIFGGLSCAQALAGVSSASEIESPLDSNDTRMQQVTYANGKLWGALDTAVNVGGQTKAGIEYFVVNSWSNRVERQGYVGLAGNNLTYPAIAVNNDGKGVMAFTLAGADHFPSAAYASIDAHGVGAINVAAEGAGPQDGFSGYAAFGNPPRPRWGDYGAAVATGNSIWIASEYIGQTCTLAQYETAPFGSCGGTRTSLANWDTRISQVRIP